MLLMTSPDVIASAGTPDPAIAQALADIQASGVPVGVVSNDVAPSWFHSTFQGTRVTHLQEMGRQNGQVVLHNATRFQLQAHDALVLAGKREDVQMGKNAGAVLIAAGWSSDPYIHSLGICVNSPQELKEVVSLSKQWGGAWWFHGREPQYNVLAFSDLSSINQNLNQSNFSMRVTHLVKNGGPRLMALLALSSRSLFATGIGATEDLMWGTFPSSSSNNQDNEVLSDFTHRLRTTVSAVRLAKRGEPLFIRHRPSSKRSYGGGGDRTNPSEQIETLHINPAYRKQIRKRNVIMIDDCTTYGLSFGVAAAFLRKAGAKSVCGVALGKFGNCLLYYEIDIQSDPFSPVRPGDYSLIGKRPFNGTTDLLAQSNLRALI